MTVRLNQIIFVLCIITGATLRSIMMLYTVDSVSGFIKPEYANPATLIIGFLVFAAALVFISSLLLKINKELTPQVNSLPFSVACVIMSAAIIYETFFTEFLDKASSFQQMLQYLFAAASAVSLLFVAFCKLTRRDFGPIITVAPVVFWIMRLIVVFTEFSTISTISDTVIETVVICLAVITFSNYAKIECNMKTKYISVFFATALLCAYVSAVGSIPRIVTYLLSVGEAMHLNTVPLFTSLATAFFSAAFGFTLLKSIKA